MRLGHAFVLVALLGLAACSSSDDVEAGPTSITTSTAEETTVIDTDDTDGTDGATTEPTTPEEAIGLTESSLTDSTAPLVTTADEIEPEGPIGETALEALLVDQIPGFDRIQTDAADRPLSIDDAAALQPDPTEELPLLETRGYQGGWSRAFRDDQNNVIVITVYDFVSALEADFYLEDGTITLIGDGGTIYEVATIPDARGFKQETQDAAGPLVVYGITFTRGNQWFLVTLLGDPEAATPDLVLTAAETQSALVD